MVVEGLFEAGRPVAGGKVKVAKPEYLPPTPTFESPAAEPVAAAGGAVVPQARETLLGLMQQQSQ